MTITLLALVGCAFHSSTSRAASLFWDLVLPGGPEARSLGGRPFGPGFLDVPGRERDPRDARPAGRHRPEDIRFVISDDWENLLRREGEGGEPLLLRLGETSLSLEVPLGPGPRGETGRSGEMPSSALLLHARMPRLTGEILDEEARGFLLARRSKVFSLGSRHRLPRNRGMLGVELTIAQGENLPSVGYRAELDARAGNRLRLGVFGGRTPRHYRLEAVEGETFFPFPLHLLVEGAGARGALALPGDLFVGASLRRGSLVSEGRRRGRDDFHSSPDLTWEEGGWGILSRRGAWTWGLRGTQGWIEGRADFFYHGTRFAQAYAARATFRRLTAGGELRRPGGGLLLFDMERLDLDGEARGEVQSWPFTPTIIDLLGSRLYYRSEGPLRLRRYHLGWDFPARDRTAFSGGVNYLSLRAELESSTWNREYGFFGRAINMKRGGFPLAELEGFLLSAGVEKRVGGFRLSYTLLQFLPTHTRDAKAPEEEPGGETGEEPGPPPSELRGGTLHAVRMTWHR